MTIKYYGCVKCQTNHYENEDIYSEHLNYQSKHGIQYISAKELFYISEYDKQRDFNRKGDRA